MTPGEEIDRAILVYALHDDLHTQWAALLVAISRVESGGLCREDLALIVQCDKEWARTKEQWLDWIRDAKGDREPAFLEKPEISIRWGLFVRMHLHAADKIHNALSWITFCALEKSTGGTLDERDIEHLRAQIQFLQYVADLKFGICNAHEPSVP